MDHSNRFTQATSRRHFLKTTGAAALGGIVATSLSSGSRVFAANDETLKVGLIGCGGRGTGAASQALNADKNVVLTAMGDVFSQRLQGSLAELKRQNGVADRVQVEAEKTFVGLDAYQKVINSGVDVVLLTTPPGFRPQHFKAAIAAGKHVFCEKPMATDAAGVRSVLATAEEAKQKKLAVVAGFCWRYDLARREFYKRIHDGAIGELRAVYATYLTAPVKPMPPANQRPAGMTDIEWQLRNWYNFVWLCGDGLVEQACHSVDKIAWAMNGMLPVRAVGTGGRQIPNNEGNIYDHIDVFYEYENGVRAFMAQRQISGCHNDNSDYLMGATGLANIKGGRLTMTGKERWRYTGPTPDMYQVEHDELFASIRKGEPINDGVWMCHSTLMAIMGRTAAYTGQEITWEQAMNADDRLVPENLSWDMKLPPAPIAMPGRTRLA
jgi:myo-inositol 2-dehydrogenase / D-chiro-inositol 1-dehydrogenase